MHESCLANQCDEEVTESSVYILQTINIYNKWLNLFFDTGCGDLVCKKEALSELPNLGMASLIVQGPITLGAVGDVRTVSPHRVYEVDIPLHNGKPVVMRGACLNKVTSKFPMYPLHDQVQKDIIKNYKLASKDPKSLPRLPD